MQKIWNKGHRIRASDKHLVYYFSIGTLLFVFVAVLVEVGFINSDTDNQLFDENFEAIAQAIADGILDTLKPEGAKPYYRVQVGLFRNWNYAQRLMEELQGRGFPAFLDDSGPFISVQAGGYDNLEEAVRLEQNLRKAGYDTLIIS